MMDLGAFGTSNLHFQVIGALAVGIFLLVMVFLRLLVQKLKQLPEVATSQVQWLSHLQIGLVVAIVLGLSWLLIHHLGWQSHMLMWVNLLIRWTHVIIGIAWIGASFYFIFLENSLNRTKGLREGLAGNLWAIHGGGFYYVEKYKLAPEKLPEKLHWFKYEAYFTWITGFLMLIVVYYSNARLYLIDTEVFDLSPTWAIAIGIGSLIVGWVVYDLLCKSKLSQNPTVFALVGFLIIMAATYALTHLFSGRAAFIHVGAMLGTMMAGNVFFVIIPSQKALVKAAETGQPLNPFLGKNAGWRSLHNNYMTLPVVFVMISNHYPVTFSHPYSWLILGGIILTSALFRHYLNMKEKGKPAFWILPIVAVGTCTLIYATSPPKTDPELDLAPVSIQEIQNIVELRCQSCHHTQPTDDFWKQPPNGLVLETPQQIANSAAIIMERVVVSRNMPLGNKTGITPEERDKIRRWINQGAPVE